MSSSTARQTFVVKGSSVSGTFQADEKITQASTGAVGKVVEFDTSRNLLFYQQEIRRLLEQVLPMVDTLLSVEQIQSQEKHQVQH